MSFFTITKLGRALLMLTAVLAVGAGAQTWNIGACGSDDYCAPTSSVKATLSEGTLTISGSGDMKDYVRLNEQPPPYWDYKRTITAVVIEVGVTSIGGFAFFECTGLTSITIPNTVTSIGVEAFYGCTGLTSITIPNSVTFIEYGAFARCTGLMSITIPNSVTSIEGHVFEECTGLTSITIPNSVTSIEGGAFEGCTGLTSITIPNSVTFIEYGAFYWCTGLTSIEVAPDNTEYSSIDGVLFNKAQDTLMQYPCNKQGAAYTIPNSVTFIEGSAFEGCTRLTSITIPNSVASIGGSAFSKCTRLTTITIPNSVTSIGYSTFYGCTGLTSITIPNSVTTIGESAFSGCTGLTSVVTRDGVKTINGYAFNNCTSLTSVVISESVTSIGASAFNGCSALRSLTSLASDPPAVTATTFTGVNKALCKLIVHQEDIGPYRAALYWKDFTNIEEYVSVASHDRVIPSAHPNNESVSIAPINPLTVAFTAGPTPAVRPSGAITFFRNGAIIKNAALTIYDASGNVVTTIKSGVWDLRDASGRPVSAGTYLARGVVKAKSGKSERVSAVVGVR